MKLLLNEKLAIKLCLAITSLAGLCSFLVTVKLIGVDPESFKLPLYQGLSAYYGMVNFGFLYIKNKNFIYGKKILLPLILMYLMPVFYYLLLSKIPFHTILIFSTVFFFSGASIFINIALKRKRNYLVQQLLAAIFLPLIMILENSLTIVLSMSLMLYLIIQIGKNRSKFENFTFNQAGSEFFRSLLLQSVLFLLPMIDVKIVESIGPTRYENYALISKISTGVCNYIFSYIQFEILFDKKLSNKRLYENGLLVLAISAIAMSQLDSNLIFIYLIITFSLGSNVSSLLLRSYLINGSSFYEVMFGPLCLLGYYIFVSFYSNLIVQNPNIFPLAMFVCIAIPPLAVRLNCNRLIKVR